MTKGSVLFKEGEPMDKWLVLLLEGELKTENGKLYSEKVRTFVNEYAFFE